MVTSKLDIKVTHTTEHPKLTDQTDVDKTKKLYSSFFSKLFSFHSKQLLRKIRIDFSINHHSKKYLLPI